MSSPCTNKARHNSGVRRLTLQQREINMKLKAIMFLALLCTPTIGYALPTVENNTPEAVVDRFVQAWNSHDKSKFARGCLSCADGG